MIIYPTPYSIYSRGTINPQPLNLKGPRPLKPLNPRAPSFENLGWQPLSSGPLHIVKAQQQARNVEGKSLSLPSLRFRAFDLPLPSREQRMKKTIEPVETIEVQIPKRWVFSALETYIDLANT